MNMGEISDSRVHQRSSSQLYFHTSYRLSVMYNVGLYVFREMYTQFCGLRHTVNKFTESLGALNT
jgi:hypothetical protein